MANPRFAGVELVSAAGQETVGPPQVRARTETMPGVDGLFVQPHGVGGRTIAVHGVLEAAAATAAGAHAALQAALRARQTLCDGRTVAGYVGPDGATYGNCLVLEYEPEGFSHVESNGDGTFTARAFIKAALRQLVP